MVLCLVSCLLSGGRISGNCCQIVDLKSTILSGWCLTRRQTARHWETLVAAATAVAERKDANWRKRKRVFGYLLIMLFVFRLATSLLDSVRCGVQSLGDLYHGRWGVEEHYKVGKDVIGDFYTRSERGFQPKQHAFYKPSIDCRSESQHDHW